MNFWNSHLGGIIIGSGIVLASNILVLVFANWRQKKQFVHEREQEIRGRRTTALADLHMLLEDQADALRDLRGSVSNCDGSTAGKAQSVLYGKKYRRRLWPVINSPASESIDEYAEKSHELLSFLYFQEYDFGLLWEGQIPDLSQEIRHTVDLRIESALTSLGIAIKEVTSLTCELNDIRPERQYDGEGKERVSSSGD